MKVDGRCKLSRDERLALIAERRAGATARDVARKYHMSESAVYNICRKAGLMPRHYANLCRRSQRSDDGGLPVHKITWPPLHRDLVRQNFQGAW